MTKPGLLIFTIPIGETESIIAKPKKSADQNQTTTEFKLNTPIQVEKLRLTIKHKVIIQLHVLTDTHPPSNNIRDKINEKYKQ